MPQGDYSMEVTIKSVTDEEIILEGYGVFFEATDLHGEKFTKDTEFFLENVKSIPVLWEHNLSDVNDVIGWASPVKTDEVGVFFELALKRSNAYVNAIQKLAEKGRIGLSTGALPQTIRREQNVIKRWQICEISATVTPADFRTLGVVEVKALAEVLGEETELGKWAKGLQEEDTKSEKLVTEEPPIENKEEKKEVTTIKVLEEKMENEVKDQTADSELVAIKSQMGAFGEQLAKIMAALDSTPAAKAGYVTQDGGAKDPTIKNFGDFLTAIKRNDEKRLASVYGSIKDLGEGSGASGGFLVPEEYATNLLNVAAMQNQIYSRVQRVPVSRESGTYPALDQYFAPTAGSGQTAFAGGVKGTFTAAGQTFSETEPAFTMLQWRLSKVGGMTEVENELIEDSPFAIEALLRGLFAVAIAARNERNILRGSGVSEPLGILNADAAIAISDNVNASFNWTDVAAMYSRFKSVGGSPVWIIHPSVWPKIMTMANGTDNVWQANMQAGPTNVLNGYPILVSEHLPQIGYTGSVVLADLSAYLMFEKTGLSIAFSDQVGFTKDVGTWRFRQRNDGKPWLLSPITLADPQGAYTVSPLLYLLVD
jgi:HK97 family phage major capsid protein